MSAERSEFNERGAALIVTFLLMLVMAGLAMAVGVASHNSVVGGRNQLHNQQAFYVAEAGLQRGRQAVLAGTWSAATSPGNTYTETFGPGEYSVTIVDNGDTTRTITSSGYIPTIATYIARRQAAETSIPVSSGTNLSLAATATASSATGGHPATDANDGSTSTFWGANTQGSGQWLRMDYGSATSVQQIVIDEKKEITAISAVEYSSNGSSWTGVSGLSVSSTGSGDNQVFTANFTSTSARYFRATFTASASNKKVSVDESQSYGASTFGIGTFTSQW